MNRDETNPPPSDAHQDPPRFCGYPVVQALSPGRSFLASDSSGRRMVLKILDDDCLLHGQLHPSIRDRLERVRELPHIGCAQLLGVERDGSQIALLWDFVPGTSLGEAAGGSPPRLLAQWFCELIRQVRSLHALGIVHGAIKPGNVIVQSDDSVILTHISPLLYNDPADDEAGIVASIESVSHEHRPLFAEAIGRARQGRDMLSRLLVELSAIADPSRPANDRAQPFGQFEQDDLPRQRALMLATLALLTGLGIAAAVWFVRAGGAR